MANYEVEFLVAASLLSLPDGYVQLNATGIDYNGTVQFTNPDNGKTYEYEIEQILSAREDDMVIFKTDAPTIPNDYTNAMDLLATMRSNATNNFVKELLEDAQDNIFRAMVQSVK